MSIFVAKSWKYQTDMCLKHLWHRCDFYDFPHVWQTNSRCFLILKLKVPWPTEKKRGSIDGPLLPWWIAGRCQQRIEAGRTEGWFGIFFGDLLGWVFSRWFGLFHLISHEIFTIINWVFFPGVLRKNQVWDGFFWLKMFDCWGRSCWEIPENLKNHQSGGSGFGFSPQMIPEGAVWQLKEGLKSTNGLPDFQPNHVELQWFYSTYQYLHVYTVNTTFHLTSFFWSTNWMFGKHWVAKSSRQSKSARPNWKRFTSVSMTPTPRNRGFIRSPRSHGDLEEKLTKTMAQPVGNAFSWESNRKIFELSWNSQHNGIRFMPLTWKQYARWSANIWWGHSAEDCFGLRSRATPGCLSDMWTCQVGSWPPCATSKHRTKVGAKKFYAPTSSCIFGWYLFTVPRNS